MSIAPDDPRQVAGGTGTPFRDATTVYLRPTTLTTSAAVRSRCARRSSASGTDCRVRTPTP